MAKKIAGYIKLQVPAGSANPSPPIGPALGQRGVNIMEFCKAFNAKPRRTWKRACRSRPSSPSMPTARSPSSPRPRRRRFLIKKAAGLKSGSKEPGKGRRPATIKQSQIREIAEAEDGRSQRQRHRTGDEDIEGSRPLDGPRSGGGLRSWHKSAKKAKALAAAVDREKLYGVDEALADGARPMPPPSSTRPSKWR